MVHTGCHHYIAQHCTMNSSMERYKVHYESPFHGTTFNHGMVHSGCHRYVAQSYTINSSMERCNVHYETGATSLRVRVAASAIPYHGATLPKMFYNVSHMTLRLINQYTRIEIL